MSVRDGNTAVVDTEHGLLVAYGRFAEQIGLPEALGAVPFGMKTVDHTPRTRPSSCWPTCSRAGCT